MRIDPVWTEPGQQRVYRELVECMARPGRVAVVDDALAGAPAALAVLATLVDGAVSLSDPGDLLSETERALLAGRMVTPEEADYVLLGGDAPPDFSPRLGTLTDPERSTTLVLAVAGLGRGSALHLTGPGVPREARLRVDGLHPAWLRARADWVARFPLGVDLILADRTCFTALPRTTRITEVH